jgi:pimeloyl-ACP methyl ester carboxylesterase
MIYTRADVDLYFVDEGRGAPVVFLHGHTLDLRQWDELARAVVAASFRAIRYDQRGHGRSSSPPAGYRIGDHAADLGGLIEQLAVAPAHVVALSRGGGVALELALRRPELVRSLLLIGPLVPDVRLSEELVESFRVLARAVRAHGVQAAIRAHWFAHPLVGRALASPAARVRMEAMVMAFPAGEYLTTVRDEPDRAWKLPDRLGEIAVPTLVMRGEHEIPDFVAMADLLVTRIPGSRLEVVPDCGHVVPVERPDATEAIALGFLRQLG